MADMSDREAVEALCQEHKVSLIDLDVLEACLDRGLLSNAHPALGAGKLDVRLLPNWRGAQGRQYARLGGGSYGDVALGMLRERPCAVKFFRDIQPLKELRHELEAQLQDTGRTCCVAVLGVCLGDEDVDADSMDVGSVPPVLITDLMNLGGLHHTAWVTKPDGAYELDETALVHLCCEAVHLVATMQDDLKLVHRDLKPDNLLLGLATDGQHGIRQLLIGDLGLAQHPGVPRELVGAPPGSQPEHGNCDAQDPAAWTEGELPPTAIWTKLGHNLSAALLAQLASDDFMWCTALRRRGFNPADSMHRLVLRVMQLSLGIMMQADHRMRGSAADHAQVWSAARELMLALKMPRAECQPAQLDEMALQMLCVVASPQFAILVPRALRPVLRGWYTRLHQLREAALACRGSEDTQQLRPVKLVLRHTPLPEVITPEAFGEALERAPVLAMGELYSSYRQPGHFSDALPLLRSAPAIMGFHNKGDRSPGQVFQAAVDYLGAVTQQTWELEEQPVVAHQLLEAMGVDRARLGDKELAELDAWTASLQGLARDACVDGGAQVVPGTGQEELEAWQLGGLICQRVKPLLRGLYGQLFYSEPPGDGSPAAAAAVQFGLSLLAGVQPRVPLVAQRGGDQLEELEVALGVTSGLLDSSGALLMLAQHARDRSKSCQDWLVAGLLAVAALHVGRSQLLCALDGACPRHVDKRARLSRVVMMSRCAKSGVAVRVHTLGNSVEGMGPEAALLNVFEAARCAAEDQTARLRLQQHLAGQAAMGSQVAPGPRHAQQPAAAARPGAAGDAAPVATAPVAAVPAQPPAPAGFAAAAPEAAAQQPPYQPAEQHAAVAAVGAAPAAPGAAVPATQPAEWAVLPPVQPGQRTGAYLLALLQRHQAGSLPPHYDTVVACLGERPADEPLGVSLQEELRRIMSQMRLGSKLPGIAFLQGVVQERHVRPTSGSTAQDEQATHLAPPPAKRRAGGLRAFAALNSWAAAAAPAAGTAPLPATRAAAGHGSPTAAAARPVQVATPSSPAVVGVMPAPAARSSPLLPAAGLVATAGATAALVASPGSAGFPAGAAGTPAQAATFPASPVWASPADAAAIAAAASRRLASLGMSAAAGFLGQGSRRPSPGGSPIAPLGVGPAMGTAAAAQLTGSAVHIGSAGPLGATPSSASVRPSAAAAASIDQLCSMDAVIPEEALVVASANQTRSPMIGQMLLLPPGAFDGRSLGQKTFQSALVSGMQDLLLALKLPLESPQVRHAFAANQGVPPHYMDGLTMQKLTEMLQLRPNCLFPDLPASAEPAVPSFVHRGASDTGSSDIDVCKLNRADCSALAAVAQRSTVQLAAVRTAFLRWSAWRGRAAPLHLSGGTVTVQFRLDNRLQEARIANGSWFSLSVTLPEKAS